MGEVVADFNDMNNDLPILLEDLAKTLYRFLIQFH